MPPSAANDHLQTLLRRFPALQSCSADIQTAAERLIAAFRDGKKLLLCGNGGSAADADHWSAELLKGFCSRRPLTAAQQTNLPPELASRLQNGLPAIALGGFSALTTAFGNDVDPTLAYAQLVWTLGSPGDVLVGLSTSGNAANVLAAAQTAKAKGLMTIALTGAGGGALAQAVDLCIRVPATITYQVQELHLPVYHTICLMIENELFGTELLKSD